MHSAQMFLTVALMLLVSPAPQSTRERGPAAYYQKWLDEDVIYLITDDEKSVFLKLTSNDERDAFIEQFWQRRDPSPGSSQNELKEEHYRRLAYANRKFGSGIPGWKTDRGRIYVMYGEPAEIEDHSAGGTYQRRINEGGGRTVTYPFQIWRYRHIDGVGDDIEIEFVDNSLTGQYKMTTNTDDKDVLLRIEGEGLTLSEKTRLADKNLRYGLHPGNANDPIDQARRMATSKDAPFEKLHRFFNLQRPPQIVEKELKSLVDTKVTYNMLPFSYVSHYFWLSGERAVVPFSVELENKSLEFRKYSSFYKASVSLYAVVTALNHQVVAEFEDRIAAEYSEDVYEIGRTKKSVYQKMIALGPGTYKLELAIKDLNSARVGTIAIPIVIPRFEPGKFVASPILLARQLEPLGNFPETLERFVIGDVRAVPNVEQRFQNADYLGVYLQAYNPRIEPTTQQPVIKATYRLKQDGKLLTEQSDTEGLSIEYFSQQRIVVIRRLPLKSIPAGRYTLEIELLDVLAGQSATSRADFEVVP